MSFDIGGFALEGLCPAPSYRTGVLTSTLCLAPFVHPATATEVTQGDDSHEYKHQTPDNQSCRQGNATNNPSTVISDLIFYQGIRTLPWGTLTFGSRIPVRSIPRGTLTFDPWNASLGTRPMSMGCPHGRYVGMHGPRLVIVSCGVCMRNNELCSAQNDIAKIYRQTCNNFIFLWFNIIKIASLHRRETRKYIGANVW